MEITLNRRDTYQVEFEEQDGIIALNKVLDEDDNDVTEIICDEVRRQLEDEAIEIKKREIKEWAEDYYGC